MNKRPRLTLNRETLRTLRQDRQLPVVGGYRTDTCEVSACLECPTPTLWTCECW